jgi:hypothetical protein
MIFDEDKELTDAGRGDVSAYGDRRRGQGLCERKGTETAKIHK